MGKKRTGEKGERLRLAMEPGAQSRAQFRQERKLVVAGISFSLEEQRHLVGIPAGVSTVSCG